MGWLQAGIALYGLFAGNREQKKSTDEAAQVQREALAQSREDLMPFRQAGNNVLGQLAQQVGQGYNVPLERAEGFRDIQNSAAARGRMFAGDTLTGLTEFNNMLNARNNAQQFSQLFNVAALGANAAARQATNTLGVAQNLSDLAIGQGNSNAAGIYAGANILGGLFGQGG